MTVLRKKDTLKGYTARPFSAVSQDLRRDAFGWPHKYTHRNSFECPRKYTLVGMGEEQFSVSQSHAICTAKVGNYARTQTSDSHHSDSFHDIYFKLSHHSDALMAQKKLANSPQKAS